MPNGHSVPLGCFVCTKYKKGEPNPLLGYCSLHDVDVHMDLVCGDFDNKVNDVILQYPVTVGMLYVYVDVEGYGYPPPTEFVPLSQISDYKDMGQEQRNQARAEAQERANKQFEERQK